ncbi:porin family protein [Nitrosomonas sp. HPC101]|uniref:porin family protein n=1 Tax=Nitrosomonas sp. HPC101 TaxID=1658667 RepID=UPI001370A84A|nr:porin family protein [Nitrosomonas sp. HPC101]
MSHNPFGKRAVLGAVASVFAASVLLDAPQTFAEGISTQVLEEQIRLLEQQLQSIRGELDRVKTDAVQHEQKVDQKLQAVASKEKKEHMELEAEDASHKHMLFFRGGFARADHLRNGVSIQSDVAPIGMQDQAGRNAWYVGAGFDFSLTNDVWGLAPGTSIFAELMFEYKQYSNKVKGNPLASNPTLLVDPTGVPRNVTVSQFTLTAAPKIKFMEGSKFRPWIIPAGLALHVISPPSESITVLEPGVMFGVGADYNIWKSMYVGADARYHLAGKIDGVDVSGLTVGGYLGIGF